MALLQSKHTVNITNLATPAREMGKFTMIYGVKD